MQHFSLIAVPFPQCIWIHYVCEFGEISWCQDILIELQAVYLRSQCEMIKVIINGTDEEWRKKKSVHCSCS